MYTPMSEDDPYITITIDYGNTKALIEWRNHLFPDNKGNVPLWLNIIQTEPGIYEFQNLKIRTDKWYSNWAPNEPNTEFNCVTMRPEDGKWKTESCQNKAFTVCARARVFSQPISIFIYILLLVL